ncbi:MAG: hypothetical protein HZA22_04650 [Nitrospirae bacterium]|nr:hypothetical protein [Nitrospirota bacterium]
MLATDARAGLVTPLTDLDSLKRSVIIPEEVFDAYLARFGWTWHQVARGEFPTGFRSLDELQLTIICEDPVLWAQSFLREPTDPDHQDPYSFFEYQKESLRYDGDALHEDGSEVGKTREIVPFGLHKAFTVGAGSALVGAPLQIYLNEIIDAILDQLSWNDILDKGLMEHRKVPYHRLMFTNGFKIDFRPSSHDGAPYRGVHARTFGIKDEAVKDKNSRTWSEFYRALLPSASVRLYSVPDGDRSCEFFKLCQKASGVEVEGLSKKATERKFRKFHWPKTLMPEPFWSDERRRWFIDVYGGEDSPGYQHNVLGAWGDPENSVFPTEMFMRAVKKLTEYRVLKLVVNAKDDEVSIFGASYDGGAEGKDEVIILDTRERASSFFKDDGEGAGSPFRRLLRSFFSALPGTVGGGADFGYAQDPTEMTLKLVIGKTHRRVGRLQLKHVTYDQQAEALDALDDIFGPGTMPWGMDLGNAGTAVQHILEGQERYEGKRYDDRIFGVQFGGTYDSIDEDGNVVIDQKTEKPVKVTAKELATDLLLKKYQRGEMEEPADPDITLSYPNHTVRMGSEHKIFRKEDDHIIDADRAGILALVMPDAGASDLFACGANLRERA